MNRTCLALAILATLIGRAGAEPDQDALYACRPPPAGTKVTATFITVTVVEKL